MRTEGKSPATLERYQERLQRFISEMGDCRPGEITREKVSLYRRHLMDRNIGPVTIGGFLSCLRGFLKYLREVQGLTVMDGEKIKRPKVPHRAVEYLTKEEVERLMAAIPFQTWSGLRDRALIEVLFSSGMRISEALSLDRSLPDTPPRLLGIHHPSAAGQDPLAPRRLGSARKSSRPVALLYRTTLVCATLAGQEKQRDSDGARTGPLALEADVPWLKAQRS